MFAEAVTAEAVLASRVVCEPLHLWMLCSPNEGAAAVVLRRARTGDVRRREPSSLRSHLPGRRPRRGDAAVRPGRRRPSRRPRTLAADDAYDAAGIGPDDVDVVECQDTDAARELLAWQELGSVPPASRPGSWPTATPPSAAPAR